MVDVPNHKAETALHVACKMLCNSSIQILLRYGASTDLADYKGRTPLHNVARAKPSHDRDSVAAAQARLTCLRTLLEANASPNVTDSNGWTPLHLCCQVGDVPCVEALLRSGAESSTTNDAKDTPLHLAAAAGHVDCMQKLILWDRREMKVEGWTQYETEDGNPYWYHPSSGESRWEPPQSNNEDDAPEDAERSTTPQEFEISADSDTSSQPSLEVSSTSEDDDQLIPFNEEESWTSINTSDVCVPPPPPDSEDCSHIRAAPALAALGHGMDDNVDLPTPPNQTSASVNRLTQNTSDDCIADAFPLKAESPVPETTQPEHEDHRTHDIEERQSKERHLEIWDTFFTNAARAAQERSQSDTVRRQDGNALLTAARDGNTKVAYELLSKGHAPGTCDNDGMTALHYAHSLETAQVLFDFGADVNESDIAGNMPLHVAVTRGARDIIEFLLSCAASIDEPNGDGDTPLHLAAWMGHRDCVECLLQRGASLVSANRYGLNVLDNIRERHPLLVRNTHRVLVGKRPKPLPFEMEVTIELLEEAWAQRDESGRSNILKSSPQRTQRDLVSDHD